jgi:peptide/nickel transport system permease protein
MALFLLRRLGHALLVLALVSTATFALIHAAPGGPSVLADPKLSAAEREALTAQLGLDRPVAVQYGRWLTRLARGDLGRSFLYQTPTLTTIAARVPDTLLLAGTALLLTVCVAIPLGARLAAQPGSWEDRLLGTLSFGIMAVPVFWLGIMLILLFAVHWHLLPAGGATTVGGSVSFGDRVRHLVLPAIVLAASGTAELLRYTRSSMRTALAQPFVRTARARGIPEGRVRWHHALRNALLPVLTVVGLQLPRLVGGAAITETVFSWPGMGRLGVEAALGRDYPLVMGITLLVSAAVLLGSLLVDLLYVGLDPRIQAG